MNLNFTSNNAVNVNPILNVVLIRGRYSKEEFHFSLALNWSVLIGKPNYVS